MAEADISGAGISNLGIQKGGNQTFDLWFVLEQSNVYIKTDLIQLLDRGERAENLQSYLQDGNQLLRHLSRHQSNLQAQYQSAQSLAHICETQLSNANDEYREALKNLDEVRYTRALDQAKQARKCI